MKVGWEKRRLGDVCAIDKVQGIHPGLPYVGLEDIQSNTGRFAGSLTPKPVKSSTFRFSSAHVLYGRLRPYLNKAIAPDFEGHCSTEIFPIKPSSLVSRDYLLYWLLADETMERINATCTGARMPRADMNEVLDFELPIPPLSEQQRIVALLDEAFAGLATAQAHAAQNLQNARALFESHLQSVFSKRGEGWVNATLADVLAVLRNGMNCKQDKSLIGSKVSRIESIWNARFDITRVGYAEIPEAQKAKFLLKKGDVLFSHINSPIHVGKTALFDLEDEVVHGVNLLLMRTKSFILPAYLDLYLKHIFSAGYWLSVCKQSINQASVNQQDINRVPFCYPDLELQRKIVEHCYALAAETQRLTRIYEQKQAALAALKKSLLHRAFSGEF